MGPVLPHQPGPVDGEDHRQVLQAYLLDDLIVSPLQKGRVDGHQGPEPVKSKAGRHGHGMLLRDSHVEEAPGIEFLEAVEPGTQRHGRRDGDEPPVRPGDVAGGAAHGLGEGRDVLLLHVAVLDQERRGAVERLRLVLGRP